MADLGNGKMQLSPRATNGLALAALALAVLVLLAGTEAALAQSSLGLGSPETGVSMTGPLAPLLFWLKAQQSWFYGLMRGELLAMRSDGSRIGMLAAISMGYGIFHAAGPGHGKAVISSYMIANEIAARRGIALSFVSAFVQAFSAIAIIAALTLLLRGAGLRQQNFTAWLEIASYATVTLLGAWLLWTKIFRRDHGHDHGHAHAHADHDHHQHGGDHHRDHGHSHAPDPARLGGRVNWQQAWSAVVAVGLRPCSGALIVLSFAFLNGLYVAGLVSVLAMAIGTGTTVAAMAALAVWAKEVAIRVGGAADRAAIVHRIAEITGAALVFVLGATLLAASLA